MAIDEKTSRLALAALDAKAAADDLNTDVGSSDRVPFTLLHAVASNPEKSPPVDLSQRLRADPAGHETLVRLLEEYSKYHLPTAAAAASGDISRREDDDIVLSLIPSQSRDGQVYVLIEVRTPMATVPAYLGILSETGDFMRRALPQFDGTTSQIVLEHDDPVLKLLRDPASALFLV